MMYQSFDALCPKDNVEGDYNNKGPYAARLPTVLGKIIIQFHRARRKKKGAPTNV